MVSVADGAIAGTYFKKDGNVASTVDCEGVGRLIRIVILRGTTNPPWGMKPVQF